MSKLTHQEQTLHDQFQNYGDRARHFIERCKQLLPEIDKHNIWKKKGFSCIYEYASKIAGLNHSQVRDALRIMRHIQDKPALKAVAEQKGLNSVRAVATLATPENEKMLAAHATEMSVGTLKTFAKELRLQQKNNDDTMSLQGKSGDVPTLNNKQHITAKIATTGKRRVTSETMTELTPDFPQNLIKKLNTIKHSRIKMQMLEQFLESLDNIEEDYEITKMEMTPIQKIDQAHNAKKKGTHEYGTPVVKPEPARSEQRTIPRTIERYIEGQSGGVCEFPHCQKRAHEKHHTLRWSLHKIHDPNHIYHLCASHHKLAHHGLINNEEKTPDVWSVRQSTQSATHRHKIDQRVREYQRHTPSLVGT
jgi:hypothetical protein